MLKASRSGYDCLVKRTDRPANDTALAEMISKCQIETKQIYGYKRVQIWLKRNDVYHNGKIILRVTRKYGLLSVIGRRKYCHYSGARHKYPNILNRDFNADRFNQKWAMNI